MQKRYLINADGTIPANAPVAALAAAGVILVVPTPRPVPGEGQMVAEADAVQDAQGVWRQVWELVPAPEPPIPDLTDIQFAQALVIAGILTAAEAEGWVAAGQIPPLAMMAIATLPAEQQPFARIRFAGARTIVRNDPFMLLLQGVAGMTDAELDALFIQAASI